MLLSDFFCKVSVSKVYKKFFHGKLRSNYDDNTTDISAMILFLLSFNEILLMNTTVDK